MRFIIIGYGFVGKAIANVLEDKHDVYSIDPKLNNCFEDSIKNSVNIDGFIISVPTPEGSNGRCDDSLVLEYIDRIREHHPDAHILIKSTTSVESLMLLEQHSQNCNKLTFSPEFLRGSVGADPSKEFRDSTFMIYGGKGGRWWHEVFNQLMDYSDVRFLDIVSAGFLKYAENSFLATKVIFFNELEALYKNTVNVNYDSMIEALALDKRIAISHTQVPGPDGKYGFGGHCLPKDTSEFAGWATENDHSLRILELARRLNTAHYRDKD